MKILLKVILFIYIFSFSISQAFSQPIDDTTANSFIKSFINNSDELEQFVNEEELIISKRLGINYKDTKYKFLIGRDLQDGVRSDLQKQKIRYDYKIANLEGNYSLILFSIPDLSLSYKYYFLNNKLISSERYYSRNWQTLESRFFVFHCSDLNLTNNYAISQMDLFLDSSCKSLNINSNEFQKNKIHYYLCKNQEEIEEITGYKSRGMCDLAHDCIISTYNNHAHELIHLLVNYSLKNNFLYVHPLLQEGIAVMLGGRGGITNHLILHSGYFLMKNKFADIKDFFSRNNFLKEDASISYSAAGLFVLFLLNHLDINDFLMLYSRNSISIKDLKEDVFFKSPFSDEKWNVFLNEYQKQIVQTEPIYPVDSICNDKIFYETSGLKIYEEADSYCFLTNCDILLKDTNKTENYISSKFNEIYKNARYNGEHYLITTNKDEISLYDLFTNTIVFQFASGFDDKHRLITVKDGKTLFSIKKKIFESIFSISQIRTIKN